MIKKTIKYVDFNGTEREEDFYFHLSKSELLELSISKSGGLDVLMERLIKQKDVKEIFSIIKEFILRSYGEKSDDGKVLLKSDEISHRFMCTEAYDVLFTELVEDSNKALDFINGILPEDVRKKLAEAQKANLATNA